MMFSDTIMDACIGLIAGSAIGIAILRLAVIPYFDRRNQRLRLKLEKQRQARWWAEHVQQLFHEAANATDAGDHWNARKLRKQHELARFRFLQLMDEIDRL